MKKLGTGVQVTFWHYKEVGIHKHLYRNIGDEMKYTCLASCKDIVSIQK